MGSLTIILATISHNADDGLVRVIAIILGLSSTFAFAWAIVGAVTLAEHSSDCQQFNYPVYAMGLAGVIMTWILWGCFATISVYNRTQTN